MVFLKTEEVINFANSSTKNKPNKIPITAEKRLTPVSPYNKKAWIKNIKQPKEKRIYLEKEKSSKCQIKLKAPRKKTVKSCRKVSTTSYCVAMFCVGINLIAFLIQVLKAFKVI